MKKSFYLLLMALFATTIFAYAEPQQSQKIKEQQCSDAQQSKIDTVYYKCLKYEELCRWTCVRHFEYNGHKYLMFGNEDNRCIVHDPDCPCHEKKAHEEKKQDNDEYTFSVDW